MHKKFLIQFGFSRSNNRKSKTCTELRRSIQNRKWAGLSVIAFALVLTGAAAQAQQPKKVPRIGYLDAFSSSVTAERVGSLVRGLRELGWVDGQNIMIEYRYADGKPERLGELRPIS